MLSRALFRRVGRNEVRRRELSRNQPLRHCHQLLTAHAALRHLCDRLEQEVDTAEEVVNTREMATNRGRRNSAMFVG